MSPFDGSNEYRRKILLLSASLQRDAVAAFADFFQAEGAILNFQFGRAICVHFPAPLDGSSMGASAERSSAQLAHHSPTILGYRSGRFSLSGSSSRGPRRASQPS
jgi:hypothetical protein